MWLYQCVKYIYTYDPKFRIKVFIELDLNQSYINVIQEYGEFKLICYICLTSIILESKHEEIFGEKKICSHPK